MARLPNGLRKVASGGWRSMYSLDKPRLPRVLELPPTEEQLQQRQKLMDDYVEQAGWNKPRDPLAKLKDREARVAVEGDTDMNHDNVEAAE